MMAPRVCMQNHKLINGIACRWSCPQALAQCDGYIRALGIQREAVDDTAGAAQMVSQQQLVNTAAVCSSRAAELYGLDILDTGIQDVKENVTRFVILSR